MSHVPYRGAGPALNDLLGGHVDLMFGTAAAVGSSLEAGTLRALAVTTAERSPALANIPTIAEEGLDGYVLDSWYGLYAPARSEEHTSELQSLMRISYAVFCL